MTEPETPRPADDTQGAGDDGERDVRHAGGGRTAGEILVDDELGQGD